MHKETDVVDRDRIREHLANERTFLAWVRTSLGVIGVGFVVVKFSLFLREIEAALVSNGKQQIPSPSYSLPFGILLIAMSAIAIIAAYFRYKTFQKEISQGTFTRSDSLVKIASIALVVACILMIFYLYKTKRY